MKNSFKTTAILFVLLCSINVHASNFFGKPVEKPEGIILDLVLGGHQISWTSLGGTGNYSVLIRNNANNTTHFYTTTASNSCLVTGLVSGNSYNVTVARSGYIICNDILP